MRRGGAFAVLLAGALAACQPAFVYEEATPEEREAWFDEVSQGLYDGIAKTLLKGRGGIMMTMAKREYDVERRRIDIGVDVKIRGDDFVYNDLMSSETVLKGACPASYLGTPLERNGVKVHVRYGLEGGGTFLAVMMSPETCAPYA